MSVVTHLVQRITLVLDDDPHCLDVYHVSVEPAVKNVGHLARVSRVTGGLDHAAASVGDLTFQLVRSRGLFLAVVRDDERSRTTLADLRVTLRSAGVPLAVVACADGEAHLRLDPALHPDAVSGSSAPHHHDPVRRALGVFLRAQLRVDGNAVLQSNLRHHLVIARLIDDLHWILGHRATELEERFTTALGDIEAARSHVRILEHELANLRAAQSAPGAASSNTVTLVCAVIQGVMGYLGPATAPTLDRADELSLAHDGIIILTDEVGPSIEDVRQLTAEVVDAIRG